MSYSVRVGGLIRFASSEKAAQWLKSAFTENAYDDWGNSFGCAGKGFHFTLWVRHPR